MTAQALAGGFLALIPAGVKVFDGQVVEADGVSVPTPPWVYVTMTLPDATERSQARTTHLHEVRVRCLVYAGTANGVRIVAEQVAKVENRHPVVIGWQTGPVEMVNAREVTEDRDVKITATNRHPMYGVLEYVFTASRNGAP